MATDFFYQIADEEFPDGVIVLLDGTQLPCYPLSELPGSIVPDNLKLDTTGTYFSLGRRKLKAVPAPDEAVLAERDFFLKNAFFFFRNADRILTDSRMYLAPVPIQNCLAYTGTSVFRAPTLGIYIEWWLNNFDEISRDKEGREVLVYHLAGSPLSGCNKCSCVLPDGISHNLELSNFHKLWRSFMTINKRYTAAKQRYQAYTLREVADLLREAGRTSEERPEVTVLIQAGRINSLKHELEDCRQRLNEAKEDYYKLVVAHHKEVLDDLRTRYRAFLIHVEEENRKIDEQCRELRRQLKGRLIGNKAYQKSLRPLNQKHNDLNDQLLRLKSEGERLITESSPFIERGHISRYLDESEEDKT